MSDLISRSKLIMSLSDYALQESPNDNESTGEQRISKMIYDAIQNCISCVEEQPTAYSVDKVAEELEIRVNEANNNCLCEMHENGHTLDFENENGRIKGLKESIEIVKQGGVSDDECEWKKEGGSSELQTVEKEL